jgi:hypothetical protein
MTCTVLYNTEDSKALKSKGFSDPEAAKIWVDDNSGKSGNSYIQNSRIVVDYAAVQVYKEMYEDMKKEFFTSMKEIKRREI